MSGTGFAGIIIFQRGSYEGGEDYIRVKKQDGTFVTVIRAKDGELYESLSRAIQFCNTYFDNIVMRGSY